MINIPFAIIFYGFLSSGIVGMTSGITLCIIGRHLGVADIENDGVFIGVVGFFSLILAAGAAIKTMRDMRNGFVVKPADADAEEDIF